MKYVMASMVVALLGCAGPKNEGPPPREPVSTTQTTSSALTISETPESQPMAAESSGPVTAVKESDRNLATRIQAHLGRDKALQGVAWRERVKMVVEDQQVTLEGNLPTLADSTDLERVVREVKGVRAVKNEIKTDDAYRH